MRLTECSRVLLTIVVVGLVAVLFCGDVLRGLDRWGRYDWDLFFFHTNSTYRSVVEFGEPPLWNPWYCGGFPMIGNPQAPFVDPWFLLDLLVGPIVAIKLKIVGHYAVGLGGMYWCCRQFGMSRMAGIYSAGTFMLSTWLALRLHSGHYCYLPAAYIPWIVGLLHRARRRWPQGLLAGILLALIVFQGGTAHVLTLLVIACGVLAALLVDPGSLGTADRDAAPDGGLRRGLSAVKLLPAVKLLRDYPRTTSVGGANWSSYRQMLAAPSSKPNAARPDESGAAPRASTETIGTPADEAIDESTAPRAKALRSWRDLPAFLIKVFLGRDQRSNTVYSPIQGFGWQEYGTYLGPLAILLLAGALLLLRMPGPGWSSLHSAS